MNKDDADEDIPENIPLAKGKKKAAVSKNLLHEYGPKPKSLKWVFWKPLKKFRKLE